jgi:hypothetical protein
MEILRHFEIEDIVNIRDGSIDYGPYDAFVYGHHGVEDEVVDRLGRDKYFLRYVNVLTMPLPDWHDAWFDWVRGNLPPLEGSIFPWFGRTPLIDWSRITPAITQAAIDRLLSLRIGRSGYFLDMMWIYPRDWMFAPEGLAYEDYDPMRWIDYERNILHFSKSLRRRYVLRKDKARILTNGQERIDISPYYIEHAEWEWDTAVAYYGNARDIKRQNVLSVDARDIDAVNDTIDQWTYHFKGIAFTGGAATSKEVQSAYALAAIAREELDG